MGERMPLRNSFNHSPIFCRLQCTAFLSLEEIHHKAVTVCTSPCATSLVHAVPTGCCTSNHRLGEDRLGDGAQVVLQSRSFHTLHNCLFSVHILGRKQRLGHFIEFVLITMSASMETHLPIIIKFYSIDGETGKHQNPRRNHSWWRANSCQSCLQTIHTEDDSFRSSLIIGDFSAKLPFTSVWANRSVPAAGGTPPF